MAVWQVLLDQGDQILGIDPDDTHQLPDHAVTFGQALGECFLFGRQALHIIGESADVRFQCLVPGFERRQRFFQGRSVPADFFLALFRGFRCGLLFGGSAIDKHLPGFAGLDLRFAHIQSGRRSTQDEDGYDSGQPA